MKALALFSGGLDSCLAVKIIQQQNIDVIAINFTSPFFSSEKAERSSELLNIPLKIIDISKNLVEIIQQPRYDYGSAANPCIDCHGLMLRTLSEIMNELEASFIITGEVLGQRPKSQTIFGLRCVNKLSKCSDLLIRPLSQKLLPDTKPIREGWIDKNLLLDIQGRGRKRQTELIKNYGISVKDIPTPGGGCLLTEKQIGSRVFALKESNLLTYENIGFAPIGRHFKLSSESYLILGRDEKDNLQIEKFIGDKTIVLEAENFSSPLGVLLGNPSEKDKLLSVNILSKYVTTARIGNEIKVCLQNGQKTTYSVIKSDIQYEEFMVKI